MTKETKQCQNCKQNFTIESEDFAFYEKIKVPPPTFCPECRLQRRMAWRNERFLHKRTSSLSGEEIISQYHQNAPFPVYGIKEYFSRDWKPPFLEYDRTRGFFEQFKELQSKVPQCALLTDLQSYENGSIYQNGASRNKNCYMVSASGDNEDCMYSNNLDYSKSSLDCLWCRRVRYSYECVNGINCNRTFFSEECYQCVDCWFSFRCKNCTNCFGCVGIQNRSYCFENQQLTKDEYEEKIKSILSGLTFEKISEFISKFEEMELLFPKKYAHIDAVSSTTCTGDYVINCKDVKEGFMVHESQDARYCSKLIFGKDCWDMTDWGDPAELCYESITVGKSAHKVFFSNNCWPECSELQYCDSCSSSKNLFGCIGLKNASFCILNRQYTEDEYKKLVSEIISDMKQRGEYGEFFPLEMSLFPYNETIAQEHFPLTKEDVERRGLHWLDFDKREYVITKKSETLTEEALTNDSILNEVIECAHKRGCNHGCSGAFRITKDELSFYKYFHLPLPHFCFNCRHSRRFVRMSPLKLWHRRCQCIGNQNANLKSQKYQNTAIHKHGDGPCANEFESVYSPETGALVYCKECYQKEVI